MTDHRISLARLTAGGMLVLAAFGASAQDVSRNSNPFQRPEPEAASPAPSAQRSAMPLTLPPPIPLPPDNMAYPALKLPKLPVAASPSPRAVQEAGEAVPSQGEPEEPAKPAKPRAFLDRSKIEATRARCQVGFKGRTLVQLPAEDSEQLVLMTGAAGCLTALSADTDWLDVQNTGNNELLITAQANEKSASRRGQVMVVTPNQTFVLTVRQAGQPVGSAEPVTTAPASSARPALTNAPVQKSAGASRPVTKLEAKPAVAEPVISDAERARMADTVVVPDGAVVPRLLARPALELTVTELPAPARPVMQFDLPKIVATPVPEAERARMSEDDKVLDPAMSQRLLARATPDLTVKPVAMPRPVIQFDLPVIVATPVPEAERARMSEDVKPLDTSIVQRLLARPALELTVTELPAPARPVTQFELPKIVATPVPDAERARMSEEALVLDPAVRDRFKSLSLREPSVSVLAAASLEKPLLTSSALAAIRALPSVVASAPPVASVPQVLPVTKVAPAPKAPTYTGNAVVVAQDLPPAVLEPVVNPVRARSVLNAMLGTETTPSRVAKPAPGKAKAPEREVTAPAKKQPSAVQGGQAKPVAVPDGYVTLDEYVPVRSARQ